MDYTCHFPNNPKKVNPLSHGLCARFSQESYALSRRYRLVVEKLCCQREPLLILELEEARSAAQERSS
jgi:hypothetical protein